MSLTITTLPNGLRVVSQAMPGFETASVGLYVDAGSRFEAPADHGVAHLLEHMVFKGTARRSARAIAEDIEAVGGHLNAYTGRDQTTYYARVLAEDVALGVDMVADLITGARFDEAELIKERDVVLQELGQAEDTPDDIVFDHLQAAAFADQPLGRPILGTADSVSALSRDQLIAYRDAHYRGETTVLAAAGKVDHAALVALAEQHLGGLPGGARPAAHPARWTGGTLITDRDLEQTHLTLALPSVSATDPDHYAAMLFAALLGGGMSSRLFQDLREERGLCYAVSSYVTPYSDTGMLSLYMGTDPDTAANAIQLSLDHLRAAARSVTPAEVQRAKAQAKAGLLMALESCSGVAEQLGRHLLVFGRVLTPAELVAAVDACTPEQVAAAGAAMLAGGRLALATVGPAQGLGDPARFLMAAA
jgi:predicted Zn-dependent peptidase